MVSFSLLSQALLATTALGAAVIDRAASNANIPRSQIAPAGLTANQLATRDNNCSATITLDGTQGNCEQIATTAHIKLLQFYAWNPSVAADCGNLKIGETLCVNGTAPALPNTQANSFVPYPSRPGTSIGCINYYRADIGDTASAIAKTYNVTLATLESWNPFISYEHTVEVGVWYCIGQQVIN